MKYYFLLAASLSLTTLIGCTNEENGLISQGADAPKSNLELTVDLMKSFAETHQGDQLTKAGSSEIEVISHEVTTYAFDLSKELGIQTLSANATNVGDSTKVDVYTLVIEKDGKQGYCIATSDERINRVYAYVEEGQLSDTTYNIGLAATLSYLPAQCKMDLVDYYKSQNEPQTKAVTEKRYVVQPVSRFAWHQEAPYNALAPECSSRSDGHCLAGCTPIAVSQAIATIMPTALSGLYDFSSFSNSYPVMDTQPLNTIPEAWFIAHIGSLLGTEYGCEGSGSKSRDIRPYLDQWNVRYHYEQDENVDESLLLNCLNYKRPHITSGFRKSPRVGHTWLWTGIDCVIDGSTVAPNMKVIRVNSLYCNWGWGPNSNGWFASYEQPDPDMQPYLDDNDQLYLLSSGR